MSETQTIRLGVIGSGLAVDWLHWPALEKLRGKFSVVMTCDSVPEAAQNIANKARGLNPDGQPARTTTDYRDVLSANDVDAVLISLPIHLNAQVVREAATTGKHVICEKPLAANLAQAHQLVADLANLKTGVVMVAENWHYHPAVKRARALLESGRIGQPFLIQVVGNYYSDTTQGFGSTPWRWDSQYRGGIITDGGVHHAALLRELGGAVEQLHAFTKAVHPIMRGLDTLVLNLRYRNGMLGSLNLAGAATAPLDGYANVTVFGMSGTLKMLDNTITLYKEGQKRDNGVLDETIDVSAEPDGYETEFSNFYNAITRSEAVVATPYEALRDMEIIMRALDSAEQREVILLP